MKIAAILTGKKTSSYKNKNKLLINKKPIFAYPAIAAKKSNKINKFYVSSDSSYILNYCKKLGYNLIKRPKHLCTANALHRDTLLHALKHIQKGNFFPEIIIVLLANAPIIRTKWINECIEIIKKEKKTSAVVPVIKNNDFSPFRAKKIKKNYLVNFTKTRKRISSNRQDLENSYFLCHNFWILKTNEIYKNNGEGPWNFMGNKVRPYLVNKSIDIHNKIDYMISKILVNDLKIKI